jgi:proline iminopeptidase
VLISGGGATTFVATHPFQSIAAENRLISTLADIGRCVTVLPRGLGGSVEEVDHSKLGLLCLVDDIEAIRRALGAHRWVFVGQSAGGYVALAYALRYGSALHGLVLSCTTSETDFSAESVYHPDNPDAARARAAMAEGRPLTDLIAHKPERVSSQRGVMSMERAAAVRAELPTLRLTDQLNEIAVPTLVIAGAYDRAIPPTHGRALAEGIRGAHFVLFDESGHFPYEEEPERFSAVVQKFVSTLSEGDADGPRVHADS